MAEVPQRRLAVLGSPIAHSKSPALHAAAFRELRLDWSYGRHEITEAGLATFMESLDASWRGLSVTMPLKRALIPLLDTLDASAESSGVANTVLFDDRRRRVGYNTDVYGITETLARVGVHSLSEAAILGGGATAASALVALQRIGAQRVVVAVRSPATNTSMRDLASRLGVDVDIVALSEWSVGAAEVVISTLPNGADAGVVVERGRGELPLLFDVAYDPWPSPLASAWEGAGGQVLCGLEMLLHQAVLQSRIFVTAQLDEPLEREHDVELAMRETIGI